MIVNDKSIPMHIAGAVVLYNSEWDVIDNINTYIYQIDKLYVVDNSEIQDKRLVDKLLANSQIEYKWLGTNRGIATALNYAANIAMHNDFDYLLMMDDDSQAELKLVVRMLEYLKQHTNPQKIGIVAAQSDPNLFANDSKEVLFAITSGSLLNLNAYKQCGLFMEELFIDAVDHEYCFRLIKNEYLVISLNYLHLSHSIGETKSISILNKTLYKWASHNPVRNYYMLRNFLFVIKKYTEILPIRTKVLLFYALTKVCLLNSLLEKDTLLRLRYMGKAISDFRNNKLGKLSQPIN